MKTSSCTTAAKLPVSVIVPVLNEELNLPECLASVAWADEIFVVDSGSKDSTAAISESHGAQVVRFHFQPGGPRKKNWSLDNLPFRNEWILIIDADERITPELEEEIRALFAKGPDCDGYYLNRMQFFLGTWLKHGGNFPSWNMRLLKQNSGRYEQLGTEGLGFAGDVEVHEHIILEGKAGYLQAPMLHEDFKDLHHFIDRHNRYSTWEATMRRKAAHGETTSSIQAKFFGTPVERKRFLRGVLNYLPCKPLIWFVYTYILRAGFLDGRAGLLYAWFKAIQEFHINAKMYELEMKAKGEEAKAKEEMQPQQSTAGWSFTQRPSTAGI